MPAQFYSCSLKKHNYICILCEKKRLKQYALLHPDKCRARDKKYKENHKEILLQRAKKYYYRIRNSLAYQLRVSCQRKKYYANNLEAYYKHSIRGKVNKAIARGTMQKQPCEQCGSIEQVQAHHYLGYELKHAYDVKWLCSTHHKYEHRNPMIHNIESNNYKGGII